MSDPRKPGVIGSLPRTRPHRRSDKRRPVAPPSGAPPVDSQAAEPAVVKAASPKTPARAKARPAAAKAKPAPRTPKTAAPAAPAKPHAKATTAAPTPATPRAKAPRAQPTPRAKPTPAPAATAPAPLPSAPEQIDSPESPGAIETAVQAAAELAEIGLHAGARALRRAVSRLPRP
jgi:hypothetical protein